MKEISVHEMISLLERKSKYLSEFKSLNEEELERIAKGNFDNLEAFYFDREILLNAISRLDKSLKDCDWDQMSDICKESKNRVLELIVEKKKLINMILEQDIKMYEVLNSSVLTSNNKEKSA